MQRSRSRREVGEVIGIPSVRHDLSCRSLRILGFDHVAIDVRSVSIEGQKVLVEEFAGEVKATSQIAVLWKGTRDKGDFVGRMTCIVWHNYVPTDRFAGCAQFLYLVNFVIFVGQICTVAIESVTLSQNHLTGGVNVLVRDDHEQQMALSNALQTQHRKKPSSGGEWR